MLKACCKQPTQKFTSMRLLIRQERTRREYPSMMATKQANS